MLFYRLQTRTGAGIYRVAYIRGDRYPLHRPGPFEGSDWRGPDARPVHPNDVAEGFYPAGSTYLETSPEQRYGFISLTHLRRWFDSEYENFEATQEGIEVHVWDVPEGVVSHSSQQAVCPVEYLTMDRKVGVYPFHPSQVERLG